MYRNRAWTVYFANTEFKKSEDSLGEGLNLHISHPVCTPVSSSLSSSLRFLLPLEHVSKYVAFPVASLSLISHSRMALFS